ncbi:MAG: preprotein translocase subunit SecG [Provencibacterium sp.]|jgi:protein translocase SecG subunit|nr:preprotein translocase subunit SecG [Provencibacterium sp.]
MGALEIVIGILLILLTCGMVFLILLQEGKGGMGSLGGEQSESFGRNAGKTLNATLKTWTKFGSIAVMVLVVLLNIIVVYF